LENAFSSNTLAFGTETYTSVGGTITELQDCVKSWRSRVCWGRRSSCQWCWVVGQKTSNSRKWGTSSGRFGRGHFFKWKGVIITVVQKRNCFWGRRRLFSSPLSLAVGVARAEKKKEEEKVQLPSFLLSTATGRKIILNPEVDHRWKFFRATYVTEFPHHGAFRTSTGINTQASVDTILFL